MAKLKDGSTINSNVILHEGSIEANSLAVSASAAGANSSLVTFANATTNFTFINHPTLPSYSVSANVSSTQEGNTVAFTLQTDNVDSGTSVPYTITGITAGDLSSGSLTGNFVLSGSSNTLTFTLSEDSSSGEGIETMTLSLDDYPLASASIEVLDTSILITSGAQFFTTTSNTNYWEVPENVNYITVYAVGGGGGGAAGVSSYGSGAGGGGGAVVVSNNISVTPGDNVAINVGDRGSSGGTSGLSSTIQRTGSYSNQTNDTYYPSYGTYWYAAGNGQSSSVALNGVTILTAGGGQGGGRGLTTSVNNGGTGGTYSINTSYGSNHRGNSGGNGENGNGSGSAGANQPGGGGGAGDGSTTTGGGYGGGGQGGSGWAQAYYSSGLKTKKVHGGNGGGVDLYGSGSSGSNGTNAPQFITSYSPLTFNYAGATNGGVGSDSASQATAYGGGGGGGDGGKHGFYSSGSTYYWHYFNSSGNNGSQGAVRIAYSTVTM